MKLKLRAKIIAMAICEVLFYFSLFGLLAFFLAIIAVPRWNILDLIQTFFH